VAFLVLTLVTLAPPPRGVLAQDGEDSAAQTVEGLSIKVETCFGGVISQDCYFPLKVTVENTGRSRRGLLRVVSQDPLRPLSAVFVAECDIPSNSRKTYFLYPYVLDADPTPSIYVQYAEDTALLSESVNLRMMGEQERLWVEVADDGPDFTFLVGATLPQGSSFAEIARYAAEQQPSGYYRGPSSGSSSLQSNLTSYESISPVTVWCRPGDLPDRAEGYQGVGGLILNTRRFYELSEEQKSALGEWIASGGSVIVWLGDDPARYQGSFLTGAVDGSGWRGPSAITAPPVRDTLSSLRAVPSFLGYGGILGSFPVTYTPQDSARTLLTEGGVPVLQQIRLGRGDILLSGLDLSALKSVSPVGLDGYFAFMMGWLMSGDDSMVSQIKWSSQGYWGYRPPSRVSSLYGQVNPFGEGSLYAFLHEVDDELQSEQLTALPPLGAIALFLVVYIILVGPVNYGVLLKMRRREWLWYTIPIIVALFVVATYTWALSTKGSRLLLTRLNIIDAYPDQAAAWESSYLGVFSPGARRYDIRLGDGGDLVRKLEIPGMDLSAYGMPQERPVTEPLTVMDYGEGGRAYVDDAYIRIWSELHFTSSGATDALGQARVENLAVENNHLRGTLYFSFDRPLEDPVLLYAVGGKYARQAIDLGRAAGAGEGSFDFDLFLDVLQGSSLGGPNPLRLSLKARALRSVSLYAVLGRRLQNSPEDELILMGWVSNPGGRPLVSPAIRSAVEETLVLVHIPVDTRTAPFLIDGARASVLNTQATAMDIDGSGNLYLTDGRMLASITFPVESAVDRPDSVRIVVGVDQTSAQARVFAFNHLDNMWTELQLLDQTPDRLVFTLSNLGYHLADDGKTLFLIVEGDPLVDKDVISLNSIGVVSSHAS